MVILYVCTFLRRKLFENEMDIMRLDVKLEGHKRLFAVENEKLKNITGDLQRELKEKIQLIDDDNYIPKSEEENIIRQEKDELEIISGEKIFNYKDFEEDEKIKEVLVPLKELDVTLSNDEDDSLYSRFKKYFNL